MVSAGLGPVPASDIAEVLSTLLDPRQIGALRRSLAAQTAGVTSPGHGGRIARPQRSPCDGHRAILVLMGAKRGAIIGRDYHPQPSVP